jgi:hypothetical protein
LVVERVLGRISAYFPNRAVAHAIDALSLVRLSEGETPPPPAEIDEWTAEYALESIRSGTP